MRNSLVLLALVAPSLAACGAEHGSGDPASDTTTASEGIGFKPPAPAAGYTRLMAETVKDVPPGGDETYCQYVMAPFDHDVDVLDVQGYQSKYGHHAVVFSYTDTGEKTGTSVPCMGTEFSTGTGASADAGSANAELAIGAYLGGIGGATGVNASPLPPGVAFRLQKGNGILLNVHYLNTGPDTIDGNAVIDIKFAEIDPTRQIAAMFLNGNFSFDIAPATSTTSSVDCVAQSDVQILMMANHMHEYGTSASTEVLRAGTGAVETLHADPHWTYDQQFNLVYSKWSVAAPFLLHTGDTVRTSCTWDNPGSASLAFPREMCVGVGFALASASNPTAPACYDGKWSAGGL